MSWLDKLGGILGFANKFPKEDMRRFQGGEEVDMFDVTPGHAPRGDQQTFDLRRGFLEGEEEGIWSEPGLSFNSIRHYRNLEGNDPYGFRHGRPLFDLNVPGKSYPSARRTWSGHERRGGLAPGQRDAQRYDMNDYDDEGY